MNTACFFGNRTIKETEKIIKTLTETIEKLIVEEKTDTFLFGNKGQFAALCYELVKQTKKKHRHIKLIYVTAEYPYINENYKNYLLKYFQDTYSPEEINYCNSIYIKRDFKMIDSSRFCIFYCNDEKDIKALLEYAKCQKRKILLL